MTVERNKGKGKNKMTKIKVTGTTEEGKEFDAIVTVNNGEFRKENEITNEVFFGMIKFFEETGSDIDWTIV